MQLKTKSRKKKKYLVSMGNSKRITKFYCNITTEMINKELI